MGLSATNWRTSHIASQFCRPSEHSLDTSGKWKGPETGSSNGKHKNSATLGELPEFSEAKLRISQCLYMGYIQ